MNRLILVGNGFDLAHNLKTAYSDFITDYISNCINTYYTKNASIDSLLDIRDKFSGQRIIFRDLSNSKTAIRDLENLQEHDYVIVTIKSVFLRDTIKRISKINWVDLENDYFDQLIALKGERGFNVEQVKKLNIEFSFLKSKLEEYLTRHEKESERAFSNEYNRLFLETIQSKDIVTMSIADKIPSKLLILSFNYTNTLEKYEEACHKIIPTSLNHIHGQLGMSANPIIFGFGDEFNKNYLEFEELRNKELLKHIKSFGYFKTSNYHDLIRFIDIDDFQVYIFGHSLGLSDRTMLKQIFEHERCKSIKIFYHEIGEGRNDYNDKTFDISSHFSDKGIMRKKIVPFNLSFPMPQCNVPNPH